MATINLLQSPGRIVIKIGSSLLVNPDTNLVNQGWLQSLAVDIDALRKSGTEVLIVSSGAIAMGRIRLGLKREGLSLAQKQASAAAGQSMLTQAYENELSPYGIVTAQALLTLNDTEDRRRWINAQETIETLLKLGAVPIINENDTVATDEIRYGDNDRLAARVAQMIQADRLVLLSDVDGLYDSDPTINTEAFHIPEITELTPDIMAMGGTANKTRGVGSGGMATKLQAAKIATEAGCEVIITKGETHHPIQALAENVVKATVFKAQISPNTARKQWIAGSLKPAGDLVIDAGAAKALHGGSSLLAAGVKTVDGEFQKGDPVRILDAEGVCLGHGLVGYNASEASKIKGLKSGDIEATLGYDGGATLIHRDNMVLEK